MELFPKARVLVGAAPFVCVLESRPQLQVIFLLVCSNSQGAFGLRLYSSSRWLKYRLAYSKQGRHHWTS